MRFAENSNTVDEEKIMQTEQVGKLINSSAIDGNGTIYFASFNPLTGAPAGSVAKTSHIIRITNTDALAVQPRVSDIVPSAMDICALADMEGQVYMFGMERLNNKQFRRVVTRFPDTVVYRSQKIEDLTTDSLNYAIRDVFRIREGLVFITRSTFSDYDSVMLIDQNEKVREWAAMKPSPGETVQNESIGVDFSVPHVFRRDDKKLYRTHHVNGRGNLPGDGAYMSLKMSAFGGNTPLINKTLFGVSLEISEPLSGSDQLEILINGNVVANMTSAHGTSIEFGITPIDAASFTPTIRAARTTQWDGYLKRFNLRYIPNPLKKKAWSFAIRVTHGIKLLDGSHNPRTPDAMVAEIEAAWESNTALDFTDVDGREYSVIVTDFKGRQPLQADERERREYIVPIELLEV
jgi:hypothetical protein